MDTLKQAIIETITAKQGVKSTELVAILASEHPELLVMMGNLADILEELVHEGEIVEIEYSLPNMRYRAKSWYLPKGTHVVVYDGRPTP